MTWFDTREELPKNSKDVLAIVSGHPDGTSVTILHGMTIASYFGESGWFVNEFPDWESPTVEAWTYLPYLPDAIWEDIENIYDGIVDLNSVLDRVLREYGGAGT